MCLVCQDPVSFYFYFVLFFSGTRVVVSVMLYPSILCVALLMDLFVLCVTCVEVLIVGGGSLLDKPCMVFRRMCVCCACDLSMHVDVPSKGIFVFVHVGSYLLIQEFESWITCVCSLHVVSLCDFAFSLVRLRACNVYASYSLRTMLLCVFCKL